MEGGDAGSGFRKHRHMMEARKLLINLLYLASAQSSGVPGWSQRETKKPFTLLLSLQSRWLLSTASLNVKLA